MIKPFKKNGSVTASAGFRKSTLVADWVHWELEADGQDKPAFFPTWMSLDEAYSSNNDDDDNRLEGEFYRLEYLLEYIKGARNRLEVQAKGQYEKELKKYKRKVGERRSVMAGDDRRKHYRKARKMPVKASSQTRMAGL